MSSTPGSAKDCGWQDWNPDYWEGGSHPFYDGPPPRCASMVTDELIPYVEKYFPAIAGRAGRAMTGISYGGIGTGHIGLRRPDMFSSLHQISGMGLPWPPACAADPGGAEVASPISFPLALGGPGPSIPTNEPAALGLCASYGHTETVELQPLPEPALGGLFAGVALLVVLGRRRRVPPNL